MRYECYVQNRDQTETVEWTQAFLDRLYAEGWRLKIVSEWSYIFEREVTEVPVDADM